MIRLILLFVFFCSMLSFTANADTSQTLVIVTSQDSEIVELSAKELKRIYLGLKVVKNDIDVKPIQNYTDEVLHEVFLQKIMYMTSRTYQRQLKIRTIRKGIDPPVSFSSSQPINDTLITQKNHITYMWKTHAEINPELRILSTF